MSKPTESGPARSISDAAVRKATGKGWEHWFKVLDKYDVKTNGHKAAAAFLYKEHGVKEWWCQMVTVEYERTRGLRQVNERWDGFNISVQKTVRATSAAAFDAWKDPEKLNKWFTTGAKQNLVAGGEYSNDDHDKGKFLKITPGKLIRFTWNNEKHCPGTIADVQFNQKPDGRAVVLVVHSNLKSKEDAEDMKTGWKWALDSLASFLETGNGVKHDDWERARKVSSVGK